MAIVRREMWVETFKMSPRQSSYSARNIVP